MVDGGIVGHLPASIARLMGADVVIAVDVNSQGTPIPPPTNIFAVMSQSLSIMGRSYGSIPLPGCGCSNPAADRSYQA